MSKLNTKNPLWVATAPVVEGLTNIPLNRLITKINKKKKQAKKTRCKRITSKGTQCKNTFTGPGKFCYAHD